MLPKHQRLVNNRIEHILKKGLKKGNYFFTIKYLPSRHASSRFCVITSLNLSPKAVVRNRLRRQIYEIFRLNPLLPASPYDVVLITKPQLLKLTTAELTKSLLPILKIIKPST